MDFPYHCHQGGVSESFLHGPEDIGVVARADDDQTSGVEAESGESRPMKIAPTPAPRHHAALFRQPRQHHGAEPGGGGACIGGVDFMKAGPGQTAPWQGGVDFVDAQGNDARRTTPDDALPLGFRPEIP